MAIRWPASSAGTAGTTAAGGNHRTCPSDDEGHQQGIGARADADDGDDEKSRGLHGVVFLAARCDDGAAHSNGISRPEVLGTAADPDAMWMPNMMCVE